MNEEKKEGGFLHPQDQYKDTNFSDSTTPTLEQIKESVKEVSEHAKVLPDELPIDGLPMEIQEVVNHVTDVFQCPRDFVVASMFVVVGSVIGNRIKSFDGKYYNPPMLWVCNVARSGSNKSEPIRWMLEPLLKIDKELLDKWESEHGEWERSEKKTTSEPFCHQLTIDDCTPEVRNEIMSNNPNGVMIYRDELRGMLDDVGRYNKSGEISQLMTMWDGKRVRVNRKSQKPTMINSPFISILGTMQPEIIASSFGVKLYVDNGFNFRWLFCMPKKYEIPKYSEKTINKDVEKAWNDFVIRLYNMEDAEITSPLVIDGESKKLYVDFWNLLQDKKRRNSDLEPVYSKIQISVERIALIVSIIRQRYGMDMSSISPTSMEYAIRCAKYFEGCNVKVQKMIVSDGKHQQEHPIASIHRMYGIKNQSGFAKCLDKPISQQAISKIIKGVPGYGASSEEDGNNNVDGE